jgi:hypothetical protein
MRRKLDSQPLFLCLFSLLVSGCAPLDDRSTVGFIETDSAGVRIVENVDPTWSGADIWRVAEFPELTLGGLDAAPEYEFFDVAGAVRLSDGRLVVANAGSYELRFYTAKGTYQAHAGRQGGGPGEFERISWIQRHGGDSLVAYDSRQRRLSIFDSVGLFVRSITSTAPGSPRLPSFIGMFEDGSLLASRAFRPDAVTGVGRTETPLFRYRADGDAFDSIGTHPGSEYYVQTTGRGLTVGTLRFGGRTEVRAARDHYYVATTDTYEVQRYSISGILQTIVRKRHTNLSVTDEDAATSLDAQLAELDNPSFRPVIEELYASMPLPETMPAYGAAGTGPSILLDDPGNLWIRELNRPGDDRERWTVFDARGRLQGTLRLPDGLRPFHIGTDFILGVAKDDLDVERVLLYELIKSGAREASGEVLR